MEGSRYRLDSAVPFQVARLPQPQLASLIATHPVEKTYVTHGAALLRAQDPAWRVVSTKWQRAVGTPEHLSGTLALPK